MAFLLDTSILGRLANTADRQYLVAVQSVAQLHKQGEILHITAQNLIEFRNVATHETALNGLGRTPKEAAKISSDFELVFPLLAETEAIFPAWKAIVDALGVTGKQVHDARLLAVCHAHRLTHLLTFNTAHFARLAQFGPGVRIVDPATI